MNTPTAVVAAAALSVAATAQLMTAFTPSFYELRDPNRGAPNRQGLREAFIVGGGLAVVIGGLGSVATKHPWPLVASVGSVAALYFAYQWAVDNPHTGA